MSADSNRGRIPVSGPITVTIKEGMVTVAERSYTDTKKALDTMLWPNWMTEALMKVERQAARRKRA